MRELEIRVESSDNSTGSRVYENGRKGMWHYGYPDKSLIQLYAQSIKRSDPEGGTITVMHTHKEAEVHHIDPCPTNHTNVVDDFMGGTVCMDCKVVW